VTNSRLPKPKLITRPAELKETAAALARAPVIAVDTESNSLYAYQERVCLIQFSTSEADYLVDPLALEDLSLLGPIFADPGVEKIFHAAEYDLICLKRDFGFTFANLFDTMLAARILGLKAIGLGSLLEQEFGVQLNKRFQRANWGQRPLPSKLLAYAQLDTHYLIPLRDILQKSLKEAGRWELAQEDFARECQVEGKLLQDHRDCWRINGAYDLDPQHAAVLQELCRYRDQVARNRDRPIFKVINDQTLVAIASTSPMNEAELREVPGMTPTRMRQHGRQILEAVARGRKAKPVAPPRAKKPDGRFLARLDRLRSWRKTAAKAMGVNSDVVLPRDLLYDLARSGPRDRAGLEQILIQVPWRVNEFGQDILQVLSEADRLRTRKS
jgi:ribonuclease D